MYWNQFYIMRQHHSFQSNLQQYPKKKRTIKKRNKRTIKAINQRRDVIRNGRQLVAYVVWTIEGTLSQRRESYRIERIINITCWKRYSTSKKRRILWKQDIWFREKEKKREREKEKEKEKEKKRKRIKMIRRKSKR